MNDAPGTRTKSPIAQAALEKIFYDERSHLFGVCYRMTGSAADAEDLVQATFERALTHPPRDRSRPWRPWLTRVAIHLARDELRRRRRRAYVGPWLPEPLDLEDADRAALEPSHEPAHTSGRYELLESLSYAFLVALEQLTPTQRAVLLLCDVFDYTGPEAGRALELAPANVRQHLRRARLAMTAYDQRRAPDLRSLAPHVLEQLQRLVNGLAKGDMQALESALARDVVLVTDGAGEFHAARVPIVGADRVLRFLRNVAAMSGPFEIHVRSLNGLPALIGHRAAPKPGIPPRFAMLAELGTDGRIVRLFSVVASAKLGDWLLSSSTVSRDAQGRRATWTE